MLFTNAAEIFAAPVASSQILRLRQAILLPTVSTTLTTEIQVEVFPFASVTVRVTLLFPD